VLCVSIHSAGGFATDGLLLVKHRMICLRCWLCALIFHESQITSGLWSVNDARVCEAVVMAGHASKL